MLGATAGQLNAGIVWDYSPVTTGAAEEDGWTNSLSNQSFAESVIFPNAVQISGMDIYGVSGVATMGDSATIRLWDDASGQPGTLLSSFTELVSIIDSVGAGAFNERVHVDFSSLLNLAAGTIYWIGMTSTDKDFTQTGLTDPGFPDDSRMAQFNGGDTFSHFTHVGVGDMAFRLWSDSPAAVAVPEPTSLAMLGIGALGLIFARRKRRQTRLSLPGCCTSNCR